MDTLHSICTAESVVVKHESHAFVTWIMLNPEYVSGALVLGSSLRFHSPGIQRICLLSKDIASKETLECLCHVYDTVIPIDLIFVESYHHNWGRFEPFYARWINYCFTRLQCLRIGKLLGLKKILVLDADTLVLSDLSELFDLEPPAGILSLKEGQTLEAEQDSIFHHSRYHGCKLPQNLVDLAVDEEYAIRGALMLLRPSEEDFENLIRIIKQHPSELSGAIGAYGSPCYLGGPDEILFTTAYQSWYGWTHIHQRFLLTAWHQSRLAEGEIPKGLHFVSEKPWSTTACYSDFEFWYSEAQKLISLHPTLSFRFPSLKKNITTSTWKFDTSKQSRTDKDPLLELLFQFGRVIELPQHSCLNDSLSLTEFKTLESGNNPIVENETTVVPLVYANSNHYCMLKAGEKKVDSNKQFTSLCPNKKQEKSSFRQQKIVSDADLSLNWRKEYHTL